MKKAMSIVIAALMVMGMTAAFAGDDCGGCPAKKAEKKSECSAEKKAECSAEKKTACSDEKKGECSAEKTESTEETKEA